MSPPNLAVSDKSPVKCYGKHCNLYRSCALYHAISNPGTHRIIAMCTENGGNPMFKPLKETCVA